MNIGDQVATKTGWPYQGAHPDCWQSPWTGTLVNYNDPRLWFDTLAFPARSYPDGPTQEQVDAHCAALDKRGDTPKDDRLGVVWDDLNEKTQRNRVGFYNLTDLLPYAQALENFNTAKREAVDAEAFRRQTSRE
jgi:hypothetical protein